MVAPSRKKNLSEYLASPAVQEDAKEVIISGHPEFGYRSNIQ